MQNHHLPSCARFDRRLIAPSRIRRLLCPLARRLTSQHGQEQALAAAAAAAGKAAATAGAAAAPEVLVTAPAADREAKERAIAVTGLAFATDASHKHLRTRAGKEHSVWAGLARLALDQHPNDPVLWHTTCGRAAAVVLTNQQSKSLDALGLGDLPAVWQLLQALPVTSVINMSDNLSKLTQLGDQTLKAAAITDCLKIVTLATLPEAQGQGLGSAIMHALLARADSERLPLYLETTGDDQVPFYARFGFASSGSFEPFPGVTMTVMLRMPSPEKAA